MLRWKYLIPRLILMAVLWAVTYFGLDPLLRFSAVRSTQAVTGARAELGELETKLFPPRVSLDRSAIAHHRRPLRNLIEFERMECRIDGDPLLRRSFVIDEVSLSGVEIGGGRDVSGLLPGTEYDEQEEDGEPSWLTEQVKTLGKDWLAELTSAAREQVNPDQLETYRTGHDLYDKWDHRLTVLTDEFHGLRAETDRFRARYELLKDSAPVDQIREGLQLAQEVDLFIRRVEGHRTGITGMVPEIQADLRLLNEARLRDQELVVSRVRMLKPDGRRIGESLLGEAVYRQLHEMLSWFETARDYQQELTAQTKVERHRGEDILFPVHNPTPRFLCRRAELEGVFTVNGERSPFRAVLENISSDPSLAPGPLECRVQSSGAVPLRMAVMHDSTGPQPITEIVAGCRRSAGKAIALSAGGGSSLRTQLGESLFDLHLTVRESELAGSLHFQSSLTAPQLTTGTDWRSRLTTAAASALAEVGTFQAQIGIGGVIRSPELSLTTDVGEKIAAGLRPALTAETEALKAELAALVDGVLEEQQQKLSRKVGTRYQGLVADHQQLLETLRGAQTLLADLRQGRVDPNAVFRQVSESGLLKEEEQQKARKVQGEVNEVLEGLRNPQQAIRDRLPGLTDKLPDRLFRR